jgi:hypothetical protein
MSRDGRVILQFLTKLGNDGWRLFQYTLKASVSFGESSDGSGLLPAAGDLRAG